MQVFNHRPILQNSNFCPEGMICLQCGETPLGQFSRSYFETEALLKGFNLGCPINLALLVPELTFVSVCDPLWSPPHLSSSLVHFCQTLPYSERFVFYLTPGFMCFCSSGKRKKFCGAFKCANKILGPNDACQSMNIFHLATIMSSLFSLLFDMFL